MKRNLIHIGTSGWSYRHWRNTFYPNEIKVKDQFSYYLNKFNSVEINNTFYRVPSAETFINWRNSVPDNFIYVIKANRFITHMKKLHNPKQSLPDFLSKAMLLDSRLGAILFQLPPYLNMDLKLLAGFLESFPVISGVYLNFGIRAGILRKFIHC